MTTIAVTVHGATGRMGRAMLAWIDSDAGLSAASLLADDPGPLAGHGEVVLPSDWNGDGDVVVDFSGTEGLRGIAELCRERRKPLVSVLTGLGPDEERALDELAEVAAVLHARNFSPGLLVAARAVEALAGALPGDYDCEITETHHRGKADAPSGTAIQLAEIVAAARGVSLDDHAAFGRHGRPGPRPDGEIGIHAIRGGDIVGQHEVQFTAIGESVTVRHEARSREVFIRGAAMSARFAAGAPPGRYGLAHALGLESG